MKYVRVKGRQEERNLCVCGKNELKNELWRGDGSDICSFSDRFQISKRDAVMIAHMLDAYILYKKCAMNDSRRGPPLKLAVIITSDTE